MAAIVAMTSWRGEFTDDYFAQTHRTPPRSGCRRTTTGRTAIDAVMAREHVALRAAARDLTTAQIDACLTVLTQMLDAVSGDL